MGSASPSQAMSCARDVTVEEIIGQMRTMDP